MATVIHPTAIVSATAQLGADCHVGPYSVVGDRVRLGDRTQLRSHVVIDGNIEIGSDCAIFPFACLGQQTQDLKHQGGSGPIAVGDGTTLREYVTIHMPTDEDGLTRLGSDCHILAYCHIAHDCRLGHGIIMSNGTNLAGHVEVEDGVVFGGLCGVHQFVRIGAMSMIGAMSKATQDVAPYSLVDGNPGVLRAVNKVGLKRNGLDDSRIRCILEAHRVLFNAGLPLATAVAQLDERFGDVPEVRHLAEFVTASERGVIRPRERGRT